MVFMHVSISDRFWEMTLPSSYPSTQLRTLTILQSMGSASGWNGLGTLPDSTAINLARAISNSSQFFIVHYATEEEEEMGKRNEDR